MAEKILSPISPETTFEQLVKATQESYQGIFPIESSKKIIRLNDVWVDDNLDLNDYTDQKQTKLMRGSWSVPVYGSFSLLDKETGKTLETAKKIKLADLPKITGRNTFIWKGNEYQPVNLLRRKPGIYLRSKDSGEVEAFFNLAKGMNFKLLYDPSNREVYSTFGPKALKINGYSLLNILGIPDETIKKAWGEEVYAENVKANTDKDTTKLYNILFQKPPENMILAKDEIRQKFNETVVDPNVAKVFLGKPHKAASPEAVFDASINALQIARGKVQPTNSESFYFKSFHTLDDFVRESFKQETKDIKRKLKRNLDMKDGLSNILYRPALSSPIKRLVTLNVIHTPEQTNPLHILDESMRTTISGEGGIQDEHQITMSMRDLDPASTGFIDPIQSPEGQEIGIANYLTLASGKRGNELVTKFKDLKTGKEEYHSPAEIAEKVVLFPNQKGDTRLRAVKGGKMIYVDRKEADLEYPSAAEMFGISANLIPFLHSVYGQRSGGAARYSLQATGLVNREIPLVTSSIGGVPTTKLIGDGFVERAHVNGTVSKTGDGFVEITDSKGKKHRQQVYHNFYLNDKNFLDSDIKVKEGDKVKQGDLLADLNYTKDGHLALGTNLRVGYIPYKGLNELDSIAISESASKKLTSEHVYQYDIELDENTITDLQKYSTLYPSRLTAEQKKKLDKHGMIQVGQIVEPGDSLAAVLKYKKDTPEDLILGRLSRGLVNRYKDHGIKWDRIEKGKIVDVAYGKNHISVFVKSQEPARIADKLSNLSGGKGVIGAVVPDDQMPRGEDGKPFDLLFPTTGIISRMNPGQVYETLASKIADKTGKQYLVENFKTDNQYEDIKKELEDHGIKTSETITDPQTGKEIPGILAGKQYFYKLKHQVLDKESARAKGVYSVLDQPVKGGTEGTKMLDPLTYYSLLSHNSTEIIKDVARKSEKNDELWRAIELGEAIPPPKPTFAFDTFIGYLKAMGVNVEKNGTQLKLLPFTDKQIKAQSHGPIHSAKMLDRNLRPEEGGLFDPVKTGGILWSETKWTHIQLAEPIPNPILEKPILVLTGLQKKQFDQIMDGELHVTAAGALTEEKTSKTYSEGRAIQRLLSKVDIKAQLEVALEEAKGKTGNDLDKLNRKIRALKSLQILGVKDPSEAYILNNIPVLPPKMRPVYPLPDGSIGTSDFNYLYRDIILTNNVLDEAKKIKVPDLQMQPLKRDLYDNIRSLYGLSDPSSAYYQKRTGLLPTIVGPTPKLGFYQSKIFNKAQDLVGRTVVAPSNELHVDELGIPERMAWNLFKPFTIREFTLRGYTAIEALKKINDKDPEAKRFLEAAMVKHPVLLNRAPSLHKWGILAFKPVLVEGEGMKVNPLSSLGFNFDFDGDAMTLHVPVTPDAIKEAWTMLPSQNVINSSTGSYMLMPKEDSLAGIFGLSEKEPGRKIINSMLPKDLQITKPLDKTNLKTLLLDYGKKDPTASANFIGALKLKGLDHAYTTGYSPKLEDFRPINHDKITKEYLDKFFKTTSEEERTSILLGLSGSLDKQLKEERPENLFVQQGTKGIRGSIGNARQLISSPVMSQDAEGNSVPVLIQRSYSQGMDLPDYFLQSRGARKGLIDKAISIKTPGELTKEFVAAAIDYRVTEEDCGSEHGLVLSVDNSDIDGRYLVHDISDGRKVIAHRNELIDSELTQRLKKNKIVEVEIRSPLYCLSISGTCVKCAGLGGDGKPIRKGDFHGVFAAQSLTEPGTQMVLSTPHKGGMATGKQSGFLKTRTLLEMPASFSGQAFLAENSGKILDIIKNPDTTEIHMEDQKYIVPIGENLLVNKGQMVNIGDKLTDGLTNPNDVYRLKGLDEMRKYLRTELLDAYRSDGVPIRSNIVESIVAAATKNGKVLESGDSGFYPGDYIRIAQAEHHNRKSSVELPLEDSHGRELFSNHAHVPKGTTLDAKTIRELKAAGLDKILATNKPIVYEPFIKGINQVPLAKEDWLSRMAYREIKDTLEEGVARGWSSDVQGFSPIPSYVSGNFPKEEKK